MKVSNSLFIAPQRNKCNAYRTSSVTSTIVGATCLGLEMPRLLFEIAWWDARQHVSSVRL